MDTPHSLPPIDLSGDPNIFPNTGIALATRVLADRVNWLAVVDQLLPWDPARARMAPGVVLLMLVMNVLTQHNPLYQVELWADSLPLPILWGDTITAHQFNDDALGRVLEDLAEHGRTLLATLGPRMRAVQDTGRMMLHSDTTAFALFGDYPNQETGPTASVELTWGHTKDHRPDLRQLMAGLTMDAAGCVLGGRVLSGNTADKAWHPAWLDELDADYPEDFWKGSYYIADSAVITAAALTKIRALDMHWLGRLPATFGLVDQLKDQAWSDQTPWADLGVLAAKRRATSATYQAQTFDITLYEQPARAFVYHSSALDKKKEHTVQRAIAREAQSVEKRAKKLAKQVFHCLADAETASAEQLRLAPIRWHAVTPTITEQVVVRRPRGRQKAGVEPTSITQYTVEWHWTAPSAERIQQARERESSFILVTSDRTCDAATALREYKAQDQNEHGFRWMKAPVHLTAFFLEKPERVVGLGYVLLLALQFARFMRAVVRHAMVDQPPVDLPDGRHIAQPSERVILDTLRTLWIEQRSHGSITWYQWTHVQPHARRILDMLQVPIEHRFQRPGSG